MWTRPLRTLTKATSDGFDVIEFAEKAGMPLLPWQEFAAIHGLELLPDGTYRFRKVLIIVARQNGKSHLKRTISLWRMYAEPKTAILGVAQEVKLARKQWKYAQEAIHDSTRLRSEWGGVRNVNGDEYFWLSNGSEYVIGAASRKSGRGSSNDEVNIDELREQRSWDAWAALSKTTNARSNSQIWCMSNAGDDESVVLNQLRDAALTGRDETIGLFEWSADYDDDRYCEIDDWKQIAQANPSLGTMIAARAIASDMSSDPPGIFRTEVLCQRVRNVDAAYDLQAWEACADPGVTMDSMRGRLAVCFDVAEDGAHATLAVAARTTDGKVRGEIIKAWPSADAAWRELPAILHKNRPCVAGWYPSGPAGALAPIFRAPNGRVVPLDKARPGTPAYEALTGGRVAEACMGLAQLIKGRQILHNDDPLLNDHMAAATRLYSGDGWRLVRRQTGKHQEGEDEKPGHVDAAYAFAGAVQLALLLPEPRRAKVRLLSA